MHPMLNIAVKAARRAGNIINRATRNLDVVAVREKTANDYVSEVDHEAEQAIIRTLRHAQHAGVGRTHASGGERAGADVGGVVLARLALRARQHVGHDVWLNTAGVVGIDQVDLVFGLQLPVHLFDLALQRLHLGPSRAPGGCYVVR